MSVQKTSISWLLIGLFLFACGQEVPAEEAFLPKEQASAHPAPTEAPETTEENVEPLSPPQLDIPECEGANCPGETWPLWELEDFQPNSPGYQETYGPQRFEGKVTLVSLLAGWCGYCRKQALHLEALRRELLDERYDINVLVINKDNANSMAHQQALLYILDRENNIQKTASGDPIYRCTFPLLQDVSIETEAEDGPEDNFPHNAWELHNGNKDDFFIYGPNGTLVTYLPRNSPLVSTNLSSEAGYTNVKQAVIDAYQTVRTDASPDAPSDQ